MKEEIPSTVLLIFTQHQGVIVSLNEHHFCVFRCFYKFYNTVEWFQTFIFCGMLFCFIWTVEDWSFIARAIEIYGNVIFRCAYTCNWKLLNEKGTFQVLNKYNKIGLWCCVYHEKLKITRSLWRVFCWL